MSTKKSAPRKRGTRKETRERLLRAVLKLLTEGGESAVTTVSVTREAGCAQSAFYQHFANVEECLALAAKQVTDELRPRIADARQRMYEINSGTQEELIQSYRDMFELARSQPAIVRLFLRYRADSLALNGVMHRFARGLATDLANQLTAQAKRAGVTPPTDHVEALAELLIATSLAALEMFLEGRGPDVETSARILATTSNASALAVFEMIAHQSY